MAERVLVHQVHPAKLTADIAASIVSNALLWAGRSREAGVVRLAVPAVATAIVLEQADLEALAETPRGRYVREHMPPGFQALRLAGDGLMALGAQRRSKALLVAGVAMIAAGWSHGLVAAWLDPPE